MARGWESKSIESQQEDRDKPTGARKEALTPEQRDRAQRRAACELSRARVLDQLSRARSDAHRSSLESALAHLDAELKMLETP